ncbi:MAG: DUF4922 domain-containing protein [Prolixibacteraceae bacterium]|nr:DUF4922 domain-containing protein [Prolixibacteraceae bacterium]
MRTLNDHILQYKDIEEESNWDKKIELIYEQQLMTWNMARNHYNYFDSVISRSIMIDYNEVILQHNPARARSTCADLSKKAIETRKCFLCTSNLPEEQKGILILNKYLILVNPFPVFKKHLTISDTSHIPQMIKDRITDMLEISRQLSSFTIFYNGPKCGASAPDHFHFQSAEKGIMPIEKMITNLPDNKKEILLKKEDINIYVPVNYFNNCIIFESGYKEPIDYFFEQIFNILPGNEESGEPMMNILANYDGINYRLILFPRGSQRPSCYYKEDDSRIIVSPASVEMAGIIVTPRIEDYEKIKDQDIKAIFSEVTINNKEFDNIKDKIRLIIQNSSNGNN